MCVFFDGAIPKFCCFVKIALDSRVNLIGHKLSAAARIFAGARRHGQNGICYLELCSKAALRYITTYTVFTSTVVICCERY